MGMQAKNRYGQSVIEAGLGPSVDAFKGLYGVTSGLMQGDLEQAYKSSQKFSRYVPGASLWQTRAILNGMILKEAHRLYDPEGVAKSEENALKYRRDNYGSEGLGEYLGF